MHHILPFNSQGIELLARSGAITDPKLNATLTVCMDLQVHFGVATMCVSPTQKEVAYIRQQLAALIAGAGPLLNGTRAKVANEFGKELCVYTYGVVATDTMTHPQRCLEQNGVSYPGQHHQPPRPYVLRNKQHGQLSWCIHSSTLTVQRAALTLIGTGLRDFRNVTFHILRDCDTLESLIGLYASGKTNGSIVQELINVGVGTGSLQSSLQGVVKNLTTSLSAQSASSSVPADCITTGDMLDNQDVSPSDPRFTAWYQKCSQYITQWASTNAVTWDKDWAQASTVRNVVAVLLLLPHTLPTAPAGSAGQPQLHQLGAQLQPARLERRLGQRQVGRLSAVFLASKSILLSAILLNSGACTVVRHSFAAKSLGIHSSTPVIERAVLASH